MIEEIRSIFATVKRSRTMRRPYPYKGQRWAQCPGHKDFLSFIHLTQREFARLPDYCCINAKHPYDTVIWYEDSAGHRNLRIVVVMGTKEHA